MDPSSMFRRSNGNSRKFLLCNGSGDFSENFAQDEDFIRRKIETLSVSKRLVNSLSQKIKKKCEKNDLGSSFLSEESEIEMERRSSSGCLSLYVKGIGCNRVGSCEGICAIDGVKGIEKKSSRKANLFEQCPLREISLPDDVLEMILAKLPWRSLVVARLVCKRWSSTIVSPQFLRFRCENGYRNPWLFVFGLAWKGVPVGEVFALDVVEDCWRVIKNDLLKTRILYSVASIGMDIYIVGGWSASKTHREVSVFSPLSNSWREVHPMRVARCEPVLGVFEVSSTCSIFGGQANGRDQNRPRLKSRNLGISDVYGDPYRFSVRRQLGDASGESTGSMETKIKQSKHVGQRRSDQPRFALIVVGGVGLRDEPLDSGEIYDPVTDSWIDIARLPEDFGTVSSGAVCSGKFYVYSSTSNKLASYDLNRGFWVVIQTSQPPPCIRVYSPKLVSCETRLFMCCVCWSERDEQVNSRGEQVVRKLWELDAATQSWSEVSRHPDAPMDKNAIFVSDCERIYGLDMFRVFGQTLDFVTVCCVSDTEIEWSRVTRKHVGREACNFSCRAKSMVVVRL